MIPSPSPEDDELPDEPRLVGQLSFSDQEENWATEWILHRRRLGDVVVQRPDGTIIVRSPGRG